MTIIRRTKGDGSLFRRANGIWVGTVELPTTDGKRRRKTVSSKDRNEALKKLKKLRREIEDGYVPVTASTTVTKWLERWLTEIHGPRLRPTTYRGYKSVINEHIIPSIGHRRLDKLTAQHVREMQNAIPLDRTAQLSHVILQRALADAIREGMLTRNVALVADKPRYTAKPRKPLTADQAKQLLRVAIDRSDPLATRWASALLLGPRQGELLGLQWGRVDLDGGVVDLAWQLQQLEQAHGCGERHGEGTWPCGRQRVGYCPQRYWDLPRGFEHQILHRSLALTRPKTRAGTRIVPIPAPLWAMLQNHPHGEHNPHNLVWHHPDGRPLNPRDDLKAWQDALAAADLPPAPLHVARNTTATLLLEAGVDAKIIQDILGHSNVVVTRGYQYVDQSLARKAMAALDQLLS